MSGTRAIRTSTSSRVRRRGRRLAAGTLALGVSSGLIGWATPAAAQEPSAVTECDQFQGLTGRVSNFPPNETFLIFAILQHSDGSKTVYQGYTFTTDSTGAAVTPTAPAGSLPVDVGFIAYRDANGNNRWDDGDDTVYRSTVTITTCPSTVANSPK